MVRFNVIYSQCFVRAGSETNSPLPASRTTRRTRASSVDLETVFDQTKNLTCISTKLRKRASVLPLQSPVKEEIEEKQQKSGVKVDTILVEEFMSSGNFLNLLHLLLIACKVHVYFTLNTYFTLQETILHLRW